MCATSFSSDTRRSVLGNPESNIILGGTDRDLPPGQVGEFEKYGDFREMARGGKAVLTECLDRIIGRTVVLKRLLPEFRADPAENRRFLREARVTAQLQHPNTVPVYEIGRDPEGCIYFAMKRIQGSNFFEILKRIATKDAKTTAEFSIRRRMEIVADACLALAYAHSHGVVHRDVKPENVWVGKYGQVVLLDWGVAKVWGVADDFGFDPTDPNLPTDIGQLPVDKQLRTLTQTGQLLGTPLYMSPEQVLGHRYLDERSDVFGAGVVLYEALAVREPFRGRDVRATFDNIIHEDPAPPHERSPEAGIPEAASAVTMKALAKKPEDRYQSMLEFIHDLHKAAEAAV